MIWRTYTKYPVSPPNYNYFSLIYSCIHFTSDQSLPFSFSLLPFFSERVEPPPLVVLLPWHMKSLPDYGHPLILRSDVRQDTPVRGTKSTDRQQLQGLSPLQLLGTHMKTELCICYRCVEGPGLAFVGFWLVVKSLRAAIGPGQLT